MKTDFSKLVACAAFALLVGASAADAQLLRTVDAGGGLYLQQVMSRALIHEPDGEVSELSMPQGTSFRRLERLEGGWMAGGQVDVLGLTDIFLFRSVDGERSSFPAPPNPAESPLRINAVPLVEGGKLKGLAWIEGVEVRETAVYAASWSGTDWAPAELVSPIGPGTQIGLTGTVLADGSWLLAWSAYDGNDDEIVWSRRAEGVWVEPQPLHAPNDQPDIVPSVLAIGPGALAAWASSDGSTYRVRLASFDGNEWSDRPFVGPRRSVRPNLIREGQGAQLLFRTLVPYTWTLLELDAAGAVGRRAEVPTESTFQPGLAPRPGLAPLFEWPGEDITVPMSTEADWQ